jgi:lipoprotein-anchoring transpeptidase ErfK/SrfK
VLVLPSRSEKFSKKKHQQNFFKFLLILVVIAVGGYKLLFNYAKNTASQNVNSSSSSVETVVTHQASKVDWQSPSEKKPYPDVNTYPDMWIKVSTSKHRVYLMNDNKVLYTMLCSTGSKGQETPKGTFEIQAERGDHFYNAQSGEGANYWVSFKDHGIYLFHTVPVDANGNYVVSEAEQLGKSSNSHGCVRLSVADAKWFYENIKTGTKVVVE